jgi:glycosyltransferase involved in cell wall biosynthesis
VRVLLVHEYYRERGGEDIAFETDATLLAAAGHEVRRLAFHNAEIPEQASLRERLGLAAATLWSRSAAREVADAVRATRPQVVHFHNTFPLVSPAAFGAASRLGAGVVATLHNYRLLCPNASFFRDGRVCEDCLGARVALPGVLHACYRGSRGQTAVVAGLLALHRLRGTWLRDVDRLIAPSQFLRSKLVEGGLPAAQIAVRPNAIAAPPAGEPAGGASFLYVGRLAVNKGIRTPLAAWRADPELWPLRIAGTGELADEVQSTVTLTRGGVEWLGALAHDDVFAAMRGACALVVPSVWYENQPLTILEAFACGLPVIAARIGALPELVREGETGLLFAAGDAADLRAKLRWAMANQAAMRAMGARARQAYEQQYSAERSIAALVGLYEEVIARRSRGIAGRASLAAVDA